MTDFHVSKSGNDANDGLTPGTAWLTATQALSGSSTSDTIIFSVGTWTEDVDFRERTVIGAGIRQTILADRILCRGTARDLTLIRITDSRFNNSNNNSGNGFDYLRVEVTLDPAYTQANAGSTLFEMYAGRTNRFRNCIFHGWQGNPYAPFRVGNAAEVVYLQGCVFYDAFIGGVMFGNSSAVSRIVAENCIFQNVGRVDGSRALTGPAAARAYNTFDNVTLSSRIEPLRTGEQFADPLFVGPAGGDFRLQIDSPCRNAGAPALTP